MYPGNADGLGFAPTAIGDTRETGARCDPWAGFDRYRSEQYLLRPAAALNAGLPVVDMGMMASASHAEQDVPVFAGRLVIPEFTNIDTEYALGANLGGQNLIALIGRDLLQSAVLVYNGTDGTVSLSI